jgi:hypothetical protein
MLSKALSFYVSITRGQQIFQYLPLLGNRLTIVHLTKHKSMNFKSASHLLIATAITIVTATIAPSKAFAATTANVPIGGSVAQTLDIQSTTDPGAAALDLTTAGEKTVKVATLAINTNNSTGYTLTINDGTMVRTGEAGSTPIAYQVSTVIAGEAAPTTFAAGNHTYSSAAANATGSNGRDLYIRYTPAALQDPGAYTATVTMTVADN